MKGLLLPNWKWLLIFFIIVPFFKGIAQENTEFKSPGIEIIPPSPNVFSFQKYVDIPVSLYTGIPNVNIPIYELKMGQLSLPIHLSYHSSGFKVGENASWVGLGWTLNAGGVISRTVRGLPDDLNDTKKGCFYNSRLFSESGNLNFDEINDCNGINQLTADNPWSTMDSLAQGYLDVEPDIYYYSFPGENGKFTFDINAGLVKYVANDTKVTENPFDDPNNFPEVADLDDYSWSILGTDGTEYIFDLAERMSSESLCGSSLSMFNPEISNYQNAWYLSEMRNQEDTIWFEYNPETISYETSYSESKKIKINGNGAQIIDNECKFKSTAQALRLAKIRTSNGFEVYFDAVDFRQDMIGAKRLDFVRIYRNDSIVKFLDFNYDYLGISKKLILKSVIPVSDEFGTESLNGYKLDYYEENFSPFPGGNSKALDYWGFYNGTQNSSLIPPYITDSYHLNESSLANREPSLFHTKIGVLKKITYPTGGYTNFNYELNEYFYENYKAPYKYTAEAFGSEDVTEVFQVDQNCSSTIRKFDDNTIDSYTRIRKWNGSTYVDVDLPLISNGNRRILESGAYQLFAHHNGVGSAKITIEFEQEENRPIIIGGLRVKSIIFTDPVRDSHLAKRFKYKFHESDSLSGKLFSPIVLGGHVTTNIGGSLYQDGAACFSEVPTQYMTLYEYSQFPQISIMGSHIGYSEVIEFKYDQSVLNIGEVPDSEKKQGSIIHTFINETSSLVQSYPFVPTKDLNFKNGKKKREVYLQLKNNSLRKIKSVEYHYAELEDTFGPTSRGLIFKPITTRYCYICEPGDFAYATYTIKPNWHYLTNKIEQNFDDNENLIFKEITRFSYDSINWIHHYPVKESLRDSKGDLRVNTFVRESNAPQLINQVNNLVNGQKVSGEKIAYKGRLPLLHYAWDKDLSTIGDWYIKKKWTYQESRVVQEEELPDQTPTNLKSYVWGYNETHPVIECSNITYQQLESLVSNVISSLQGGQSINDLDELLQLVDNGNFQIWKDFNLALSQELAGSLSFFKTYTYENGIDISSITDSNMITQYYFYDDFHRLIRVEDNDHNIIKVINYNYSEQ